LNTANATTTDCALASNAKVQWAWTNLLVGGMAAADNVSVIVFGVTEDWKEGLNNTGSDGTDPIYIIVGSSTAYNKKAWGLLAWMLYAEFIDMDGVTSVDANGKCTGCNDTE